MLSNKSHALILALSICLSAGSVFLVLVRLNALEGIKAVPIPTGEATGAGQGDVNVTVNSQAVLTAIGAFINFGGGFANGSMCSLNSTSSGIVKGNCTTFRDANDSIVIRNDGNVNLSVNISFSKTATSWIGGTN